MSVPVEREAISMGKVDKTLTKVLRGASDANVPFDDLCHLLHALGFDLRIKGSHHIFTKDNVKEILNLQPKGKMAKPYQVKQVRTVILHYRLGARADE